MIFRLSKKPSLNRYADLKLKICRSIWPVSWIFENMVHVFFSLSNNKGVDRLTSELGLVKSLETSNHYPRNFLFVNENVKYVFNIF